MAVGLDVWVIGLLNRMVGYSVMAESKRETSRVALEERERKWGEKKERGSSNGNKLGPT